MLITAACTMRVFLSIVRLPGRDSGRDSEILSHSGARRLPFDHNNFDIAIPAGRMIMQMMSSELERAMFRERTSAGLAAARGADDEEAQRR
jgi:DNA invertase Pin-like site-specific DNA recombinase